MIEQYFTELLFLAQRFNAVSLFDILIVSLVIFIILRMFERTQGYVLVRGIVFIIIIIALLFALADLPAFSWLMGKLIPVLMIVVPVIFAPEIRRVIEKIGRANAFYELLNIETPYAEETSEILKPLLQGIENLSERRHGALIVLCRHDNVERFMKTGVIVDALVTPEMLLQIFYPNTPLHDGAVIICGGRITAAACVMPLSSSEVLVRTPERQMGLRHRAALGTAENVDAVTVVVSEETGSVSIAVEGQLYHRISMDELSVVLHRYYKIAEKIALIDRAKSFFEKFMARLHTGE